MKAGRRQSKEGLCRKASPLKRKQIIVLSPALVWSVDKENQTQLLSDQLIRKSNLALIWSVDKENQT